MRPKKTPRPKLTNTGKAGAALVPRADAHPHPATAASTPARSLAAELLSDVEAYILRYVAFPDTATAFVAALYAAATYMWPMFDAFPYLVITSDTKRSGKTRFSELLSFVCANPRNFAGTTPATIFRSIRDEAPTIFIDEAETLASESMSLMRVVLNVGYRKGQTIPRMSAGGIEEWPAYCPKIFILIGDVYDTLRDRAIVVRMQRSTAPQRFVYEPAKAEGGALATSLQNVIDDNREDIHQLYTRHEGLQFLMDRDEEIWLPLFAVCSVLAPHRLEQLTRLAVDLSTEKTADKRRVVDLRGAEQEADDMEYKVRLLRDLAGLVGADKYILTADALDRLRDISTAPWRKFRGKGLTMHDMSKLLSSLGVAPKNIRTPGGREHSAVRKGYLGDDIRTATLRNMT